MKGPLKLNCSFFFLLCKLSLDFFEELYPFPPSTLDVNIFLVLTIFIYSSLVFVHMLLFIEGTIYLKIQYTHSVWYFLNGALGHINSSIYGLFGRNGT